MKLHLNSTLIVAAVSAFMTLGCSGNKENKTDAVDNHSQQEAAAADIRGQWLIENPKKLHPKQSSTSFLKTTAHTAS